MLLFACFEVMYFIQKGEVIKECCVENQPQIIRYIDADDEITAQYIVAVEKQTFCQCATLLGAVYTFFPYIMYLISSTIQELKIFISLYKTSAFALKINHL